MGMDDPPGKNSHFIPFSLNPLVPVFFVDVPYPIGALLKKTRNQINDTFLFQNRVKVKVVGEVSEK